MPEFSIIGILPEIAKNLNISIFKAGYIISAYALGIALENSSLISIWKNSFKNINFFIFCRNLIFAPLSKA